MDIEMLTMRALASNGMLHDQNIRSAALSGDLCGEMSFPIPTAYALASSPMAPSPGSRLGRRDGSEKDRPPYY